MSEEGIRLAKRVAALQGCSRREAEGLVAAGAVQVQGQVVTDPARRVLAQTLVQVSQQAPGGPVTVLLHKPARVSAADALRAAWAAVFPDAVLPAGLQEWMPLPLQACGLSVWSDERPVVRRLQDRERPLQTEWLLTLPLAAAGKLLPVLQSQGLRASLGHERDGVGQWRLVCQGDVGPQLADFLACSPLATGIGAWTLRRQRIGRLGLSPLGPGQARQRLDFERF